MSGRHAEVLRRLDDDHAFFAEHAVQIVGADGRVVPLVPKRAQREMFAAAEAQRAAGRPMRLIILKARKLGFSTAGVSMVVQRATRKPNHHALIVGQDARTAAELGNMAEFMYNRLPAEIKPPLANWSRGDGKGYFYFGEPSRQLRARGEVGLNSSIRIDNAKERDAGRGFTYRTLLLTEVAFWPDESKLLALLNAVPDDPDTLVVFESTANGFNHFKRRWDRAVAGESSYHPIFAPWHEDPAYRDPLDGEAEQRFWDELYGRGEVGEDEPRLVELFGCDAGQLAWRRRVIADRCNGDIEQFNQEYPGAPEDAFIATGRTRFAMRYVRQVLARVERVRPEQGLLAAGAERAGWRPGGEQLVVPTRAVWTPREATGFGERHPWWLVWEHPRRETTLEAQRRRLDAGEIDVAEFDRMAALADRDGWIPPGQYIVAVDVAGGEEDTTTRDLAYHAIEVIDHATLAQVAEFAARGIDAAELARQALLAGLYWNEAWIAVETTGGWGIPVVKDHLWRRFRYRALYRRPTPDSTSDVPRATLGWMTSRRTRPQMEAGLEELLRQGEDGIRSKALARELLTYMRQPDGKTGPAPGEFSDRLMAYMIAQQVAREKLLRRPRRRPEGGASYLRPRNPITGY